MSDNLLENVCPIYQGALGKTLILMEYAEHNSEKPKILKEFSDKYFMLPVLWRKLIHMPYFSIHGSNFNYKKSLKYWQRLPEKVNTTKVFHYYFIKFHGIQNRDGKCDVKHIEWDPKIRFYWLETSTKYEETLKSVENAFDFPHKNIQEFYEQYLKFGAKPLSEKMKNSYTINSRLMKNFKNAEDDDEKWIENMRDLAGTDNEEVMIANFEFRLGKTASCKNKEIWKTYIEYSSEYLEFENSSVLLDVYLRYCRFFIGDEEMRKAYRRDINYHRILHDIPVSLYWIDTIEWELDFGDLQSAYDLLQQAVREILKEFSLPKLTSREGFIKLLNTYKEKMKIAEANSDSEDNSDSDGICAPPAKRSRLENSSDEIPLKWPLYFEKSKSYSRLSIPSFVATYVTQNANASLLFKLYQSSKYFYSIHSIPICHRLVIEKSVKPRYFQQSLFYKDSEMKFLGSQKFVLSNSLCFCAFGNPTSTLPNLISKLHKCEATVITICRHNLNLAELEFFVSSGKVKHFECRDIKVFDENNVPLSEEEIKALIESYGNKLETFFNADDGPNSCQHTRADF